MKNINRWMFVLLFALSFCKKPNSSLEQISLQTESNEQTVETVETDQATLPKAKKTKNWEFTGNKIQEFDSWEEYEKVEYWNSLSLEERAAFMKELLPGARFMCMFTISDYIFLPNGELIAGIHADDNVSLPIEIIHWRIEKDHLILESDAIKNYKNITKPGMEKYEKSVGYGDLMVVVNNKFSRLRAIYSIFQRLLEDQEPVLPYLAIKVTYDLDPKDFFNPLPHIYQGHDLEYCRENFISKKMCDYADKVMLEYNK